MSWRPKQLDQKGFTLIEVLIITPIFLITCLTLLSFLINQYGDLVKKSASLNLIIEAQSLLFVINDEMLFAEGYDETMTNDGVSLLSDAHDPAGGWDFNTSPATLIIREPAATGHHQDPDREFVRRNQYGCTGSGADDNAIVYNNIIYFVEGTSLYKRTLIPGTSASLCGTNYKKQTCPAGQTSSSCKADVLVTTNVADFEVAYYDDDDDLINPSTGSPLAAERIQITLTLTDTAFGEEITETATLSVKQFN